MAKLAATTPLSLAHLSELEIAPADLIELAARAGFASVGLRTVAAAPGGIAYPLRSGAQQADVRRRAAETGVSVLYIEMVSLSEATRIADCRPVFETGAAIGASRLAVAGDSANLGVIGEKLAELCDMAAIYGIAVDLEFMPFRPVATFADAVEAVRLAQVPNAHVLLDALHVFRSGSGLEEIEKTPAAVLGTFQICDAPNDPPPRDQLVVEARTRRLLPGRGGLPLRPLIEALPPDIPVGVEVPLALQHPDLEPAARLAMLATATRQFLAQGNNS